MNTKEWKKATARKTLNWYCIDVEEAAINGCTAHIRRIGLDKFIAEVWLSGEKKYDEKTVSSRLIARTWCESEIRQDIDNTKA